MSATNHTTNYELPIFIGTDKPAWLVDWNGAMTAIDTAIHTAEGKADQAGTDIGGIESSISTINSTLTSINNAVSQLRLDTNANTGSIHTIQELIGNGTPTTSDKTLIGAINELDSDINMIHDLGNQTGNITFTPDSHVTLLNNPASRYAFNSDGSMGKIYGHVGFEITNASADSEGYISIATTQVLPIAKPDTAYRIYCNSCLLATSAYAFEGLVGAYFKINTNGSVTLQVYVGTSVTGWTHGRCFIGMVPFVIFAGDFGD